MSSRVKIRSQSQILGNIVRTLSVDTDITAFERGSDLVTTMEAVSTAIFQAELTALKALESIDIDSLKGNALDRKAVSMRLPDGEGGYGRKKARRAAGPVTILDTSFTKIAANSYAGKPEPYAGSRTLYLKDASKFPDPNNPKPGDPAVPMIYVGRGTVDRFEGPIEYTDVINNGSFWTIHLANPLTKSHLQSDIITLAQGGERIVNSGTTIQVPPNSEQPAVVYSITNDVVLADGEDTALTQSVAVMAGENGNALAGAIKEFLSTPFLGAAVTNSTSYRNGKEVESDESLRQRIKNYPSTLSRGVKTAIVDYLLGATDSETGRTISSVVTSDPLEPGDRGRIYIDDGTGLEPTFGSQPLDILREDAYGQETDFRLSQYPVTATSAVGETTAPFFLTEDMTLTVQIDNAFETYRVNPNNYRSLTSATSYEIVRDFNTQSNMVGWRTINGGSGIVGIDLSGEGEIMRIHEGDLQRVLGLPVAEIRPIYLYENNKILSFKGKTAALESVPRNQWNLTQADVSNVTILVDGIKQTFSVTNSDFSEFNSTVATATVSQWATILSRKVAGVRFFTQGQFLIAATWQENSENGSIVIPATNEDGTPSGWVGDDKIWNPTNLSDYGADKDFKFNRFSGEIKLLNKPEVGSTIEAGTRNSRAVIRSHDAVSGIFSLDPTTQNGNSKMIVAFDGDFEIRNPDFPDDLMVTASPSFTGLLRLSSNSAQLFRDSAVMDYIYLIPDLTASSVMPADTEGFYRIKRRGLNKEDSDINYVGLSVSTEYLNGVPFSVRQGSDKVFVELNNHGLRTGDFVTTSYSGPGVGGISDTDLSVVDAPIVVLSKDQFTYSVATEATSNAGSHLSLGHNVLTVNQPSHDFESGAMLDLSAASPIGGISTVDLNTVSDVEFVDLNNYKVRALAAATSQDSGIISATYLADSWIEIEVSDEAMAAWTPVLSTPMPWTPFMLSVFKSEGAIPQLVDFGSVGDQTADQLIETINSQVQLGKAEKANPQSILIRSNSYNNATTAILATIGNASSVFSRGIEKGIQPHVGNSVSKELAGAFPHIIEIVHPTDQSDGYSTRSYLRVNTDYTNLTDREARIINSAMTEYPEGFQHLWITGPLSGYSARVYNNQTVAPFTGVITNGDSVRPTSESSVHTEMYSGMGQRLSDLPLNNHDSLVIEMDGSPSDKTVAVPMSKTALIQDIDPIAGIGSGQVISFRLKDPDDFNLPFFADSSVYKDFNFKDFKILTKTVGIYREDSSDNALIVRSAEFGSQTKLRFIIMLPSEAGSELSVAHINDFDEVGRTTVVVALSGGSEITAATLSSGRYRVSSWFSSTPKLFDWRFSGDILNENSDYVPGNVLTVGGNSPIAGSYLIESSNYVELLNSSATVQAGSAQVTVNSPGHGLVGGDLVTIQTSSPIGGLTSLDLSIVSAQVSVVDANTFTYNASNINPGISIVGEASVSHGSDIVEVNASSGHGLSTGDTVNITANENIGGISSADLSVIATVTVVSPTVFTYQASASGNFNKTCSVSVLNGSNIISVNETGHGLRSGDLVTTTALTPIGGISELLLSVVDAPITVVNADNFYYVVPQTATSDDSGSLDVEGTSMTGPVLGSSGQSTGVLDNVHGGSVSVKSPGPGTVTPFQLFDAAQAPLTTYELAGDTYNDIADAINEYSEDSPVVSAEALGASPTEVTLPSYLTYASEEYTGSDMQGAFNLHAMEAHMSGEAGIWQYDSSDPNLNNIKATVQSSAPLFPTATETLGTSYNPIDEEVIVVPTNAKTVASWMAFKAMSSLNVMADAERVDGDKRIQVSSKEDGSAGKVYVSGVTANELESFVIGNSSFSNGSIRTSILRSAARSMIRGQLVMAQNSISSEIRGAYRNTPQDAGADTTANRVSGDYFRNTNSIKYLRTGANTARIVFLRNGMDPAQTEPLVAGDRVRFTAIGSSLMTVSVTSGTSILSARTGDMLYVSPNSSFSEEIKCKTIPSVTPGLDPEYIGFPVVNVVDEKTVVCIAPGVSTDDEQDLLSPYDLVFLPAVWNEKNIRTNHYESNKFDYVAGSANFLVKTLGQGMVSVYVQNNYDEELDDAMLDVMSVSSDDYAVFGSDFAPLNRGTFKIVAHNGRNQLVIYNPNGGEDELNEKISMAGQGESIWTGGEFKDGVGRSLRIISGDSVRIGDKLRISTQTDFSQWFNDSFVGSHTILGIGLQALDYTGEALPHTSASGVFNLDNIAPYVEIALPNAPLAVTDEDGLPVDSFLIGNNTSAIGFTEGSPYFTFKYVAGVANNPNVSDESDVFLLPAFNASRLSESFGSKLVAWNKLGFDQAIKAGIDGYKVYTGLVREAHRIVDGLPTNTINYPGVKAFGATLEVQTSLYKTISLSLRVRPTDGVTLNSISEVIKSSVATYVNNLGPGEAVVISEIIRVVKSLPGVYSVEVSGSMPPYEQDRIVMSDIEKAYILNVDTDIVFG